MTAIYQSEQMYWITAWRYVALTYGEEDWMGQTLCYNPTKIFFTIFPFRNLIMISFLEVLSWTDLFLDEPPASLLAKRQWEPAIYTGGCEPGFPRAKRAAAACCHLDLKLKRATAKTVLSVVPYSYLSKDLESKGLCKSIYIPFLPSREHKVAKPYMKVLKDESEAVMYNTCQCVELWVCMLEKHTGTHCLGLRTMYCPHPQLPFWK